MLTYYKTLDLAGRSKHGGNAHWHLPRGSRPGKWMPAVDDPECCECGYHVCTLEQLLGWLGPRVWIVEVRGAHDDHDDKSAWEQARLIAPTPWDERSARLFACDCAERALQRERDAGREPDPRSWNAITVARRFANGEATEDELAAAWAASSAASSAASRAAGRAAGWAASRAAYRAASSAADWAAGWSAYWAAYWAASSAAYSAAYRAACWAADRAENSAAEREWQAERLGMYLRGEA